MKKIIALALVTAGVFAQQKPLDEHLLWQLGRIKPIGLSDNKSQIYYAVSTPDVENNNFVTAYYQISVDGKYIKKIDNVNGLVRNTKISADGKYTLSHAEVKVNKVLGKDYYENLEKSTAYVYDALDNRHWDTDNEGKFSHIILTNNTTDEKIDLLQDQPYYSPQKPFGGTDDYIWSPDAKKVIYVSKKKFGTEYAFSTNTDLYEYDVETKQTKNLTEYNKGYDTHPVFSPKGQLSWLQMKTEGNEADKNDIILRLENNTDINLTKDWDGTVDEFAWSEKGDKIYFRAPINGTVQLFEITVPKANTDAPKIKQLTEGMFDVASIVGFSGTKIIVTRTDFNTAAEIYSFDLKNKKWHKITRVNDELYKDIAKVKVQKRMVKTTDGKEMLVWVILPPDFDHNKKHPTLLYCQGGPQSIVSQFYSFRWNFQLMASKGYIIVAPNRRGLPGFGVEWNKAISGDWGGQPMKDYLSAIDAVSEEKYVDKEKLGAIGASYGGYSVYMLAGIHQNRFKTFISHCGVFNLQSMYGTTEEMFFPTNEIGGAYWNKTPEAEKAYKDFNPINYVDQWNTPILVIHGGKDYRVPIGQGQEAFQAAQVKGLKSRFLYFPDENHWVLKPQNGLVWQKEFYRWLEETLLQ